MTDTAVESVAVLSTEDVGWMMRSIRDAQSRISEELATHAKYRDKLEQEIALVNEGYLAAIKSDVDRVTYLTAQLEAHLLNKRAADDSVKSIRTPWGSVESREQQPEYVKDDPALLAWLQANHTELIREKTTLSPDWETIKAYCHPNANGQLVTPDGEVVPGVEVTERPPKVTVKVTP